MATTIIEWAEFCWNVITGCSKLSSGCKNCYAEAMAKRLKAMGQVKYRNGFEVTLHPSSAESAIRVEKTEAGLCELHVGSFPRGGTGSVHSAGLRCDEKGVVASVSGADQESVAAGRAIDRADLGPRTPGWE